MPHRIAEIADKARFISTNAPAHPTKAEAMISIEAAYNRIKKGSRDMNIKADAAIMLRNLASLV